MENKNSYDGIGWVILALLMLFVLLYFLFLRKPDTYYIRPDVTNTTTDTTVKDTTVIKETVVTPETTETPTATPTPKL